MSGAVLQSSLTTSLARYRRSKALWLLLLAAPIAARYMISQKQGEGISITIGSQLPVLTSPVLGVWLGIVASTIVMPIAYIYLRANTTRRQPWQVEEVTSASRVSIALGRFFADGAVLLAMLAMLSLAGLFLGWLMVTGPWNPAYIVGILWIVAAPTFLAVAAIRILFDAVPALRGALGDLAFFCIWMASLVIPVVSAENASTLGSNLADLTGSIRPLVEGAPEGSNSFAIGGAEIKPGRIELDVFRGLASEGYLLSRAIWVLFAAGIAAFAGLIYRPHKPVSRKSRLAWLSRISLAKLIPAPKPAMVSPVAATSKAWNMLLAELRLILSGPLALLLVAASTAASLAPDFRHIGSPAGLLVLVFALSAHAGRSEARNLLALTQTMTVTPAIRRAMFVAAGTLLAVIMALPAIAISMSLQPLILALTTGAAASVLAIGLAWMSGSAFVPRLALLIVWYGYFAS